MGEERKMTPEELFRFGLEGTVELAKKLAPYFKTTEELMEAAELALKNDGQFRLLMQIAIPPQQGRR